MTQSLITRLREAECQTCKGDGYVWLLPPGMNAFEMGGWAVAKRSRKHVCKDCGGSGKAILQAQGAQDD